jgi:hypothetical protein
MNSTIASHENRRELDGLSSSTWCLVAAFGTYFCMYAFRKPYTAAGYQDLLLGGIGYKAVLVIAQVVAADRHLAPLHPSGLSKSRCC